MAGQVGSLTPDARPESPTQARGAAAGRTIRVVDRPDETVGSRVARFRMAQEWTQEELAFEADLTQATVSLIENGRTGIRAETLYALAGALGVSVDDLWLGEEDGEDETDAVPHANCPPVLGCRTGSLPRGWVREGGTS